MKNIINALFFALIIGNFSFAQETSYFGLKVSYSSPHKQLGSAVNNALSYELSSTSSFFYNVRSRFYVGFARYKSSNVPFFSISDYSSWYEPADYYLDHVTNLYAGTGLDYQVFKIKSLKLYVGPDVFIGKSYVASRRDSSSHLNKDDAFFAGAKIRVGAELNIWKVSLFAEYCQGAYYSKAYFYKSILNPEHKGLTGISELGVGIRF